MCKYAEELVPLKSGMSGAQYPFMSKPLTTWERAQRDERGNLPDCVDTPEQDNEFSDSFYDRFLVPPEDQTRHVVEHTGEARWI